MIFKSCDMFFFFFKLTIDPVFNTNHYESIGGYVEVCIRLVFMLWFIAELKETSENLEAAAIRNTKTESKIRYRI